MQQRTVWGEVEGMVCTRLGGDLSLFISVCVYMYAYESLCFHRRSKVLYSRPVTFLCKEICIQNKPCGEEKALSFSLQQFSGKEEAFQLFLGHMWGRRKPAELERESKPSGK